MVGVALVVGVGDGAELVDDETSVVFGLEAGSGTDVATGDAADVEGTEGKLRTGLADSLGCDDTDSLALLDHLAGGQVAAVALGADAMLGLAGEDGTNLDFLDGRLFDFLADFLGELFAGMGDEFAGLGMVDVVDRGAAENLLAEALDDILALLEGGGGQAAEGAAVFLVDNHVVGNVNQTAGEVTGVSRLQSGIGQTLTGTVGGDEVLEHREAFLEVGDNGVLDNLVAGGTSLLRLGHQAAHARELADLLLATTGAGVVHHEDGVEALVVGLELLHEGLGELVVGVGPDIDDVVVTFVVGDKTHGVLGHDLLDLLVGFLDELFLLGRDDDIAEVEGEAAAECLAVAHVLDVVEEGGGDGVAALGEDVADDVAQGLLAHHLVDEAVLAGDNLVEDDAADGGAETVGLDVMAFFIEDGVAFLVALDFELGAAVEGSLGGGAAVDVGEHVAVLVLDDLHEGAVGLNVGIFVEAVVLVELHGDAGVEVYTFLVVGDDDLLGGVEALAFTLDNLVGSGAAGLGHVVQTEHHVLRRNGDRSTIGGVEDVVGGQHEDLGLENGSITHGDMDSHLVTVEVGVEAGTHERVQTDGLAFDKTGLEGLDAETVQRRSTVEQDGMALQYVFKDFPHDGFLAVDDALGALDGFHQAALEEFADDIGFEQLGSHVLGETALVHSQFGADDDDRTAGVVDTFTEKVLAEAALFALEGVGERLEGAVGLGLDAGDLAAVVEEGVDRFLEHALLITHNDLGGLDFDKAFQAVVADDDAAVELVDVGGGETAAIQGHERTQVGRNDRNDIHDHPLGTIVHAAGTHGTLGFAEGLDDVQAFQGFLLAGHGCFARSLGTKVIGKLVEVELAQELVESLGAHAGDELVGVVVGKLVVSFGQ